jgi:hypothetical protein
MVKYTVPDMVQMFILRKLVLYLRIFILQTPVLKTNLYVHVQEKNLTMRVREVFIQIM